MKLLGLHQRKKRKSNLRLSVLKLPREVLSVKPMVEKVLAGAGVVTAEGEVVVAEEVAAKAAAEGVSRIAAQNKRM